MYVMFKILYENCSHTGNLHTELILSHEHLHVLALFSFFLALQASFVADGSADISIDDPDFWEKWAKKAHLDLDQLANKVGSFLLFRVCVTSFISFFLSFFLSSISHAISIFLLLHVYNVCICYRII